MVIQVLNPKLGITLLEDGCRCDRNA